MRILIIDPGASTTKIGIWEDNDLKIRQTIRHNRESMDRFERIADQEEMRFSTVEKVLEDKHYLEATFDAVVGRGGLIRPVQGGTYEVDDTMVDELRRGANGEHASNLGALLAHRFARRYGVRAFIVDPVVVDELQPHARLSGMEGIERKSIFHALNQKSVAREIAGRLGKAYDEVDLIVAHIGSGVSVGVHRRGRVVDVNNALDGDGPYSQERTGGLPVRDVVTLIEEGAYSPSELLGTVSRGGGLSSYIGETDLRTTVARIEAGDEKARLVFEGMGYQIAKEIGASAAVLGGNVDGIVLTGGGAHCERLVSFIRDRVSFIGSVFVVPGELELEALAVGVSRVLRGEEEAKVYGNADRRES